MPFNGSGGTSQPTSSIYPAVASTLIESAKANISIADIYTMLASCLLKDGQQTATARIPFAAGISTDTVNEKTTDTGVTIDSVLLKDGEVDGVDVASFKTDTEAAIAALWTTGDVKLTIKTVADTGWVLMNDGTIGDASSGATTRANADTSALFTLLWTNTADADCAVSTGRGATAAADFAAHKTIALPKALGRALAVYGSGSGLTSRNLAHVVGSENAITVAHTHTGTTAGQSATHTHPASGAEAFVIGNTTTPTVVIQTAPGAAWSTIGSSTSTGNASADHTHSFTSDSTGSSGTGANVPPTVFLNVMIKL